MSLNTYGAILTYAIQLEQNLHQYYQNAGKADLAQVADKRRANLERVRRENVVEITLEAIDGLDEANYPFDFTNISAEGQANAERLAAQFYTDVAPKINVRAVQRVLERYAKEHSG
jgi:arginine decarboxylase-like protein